MNGQKNRKDQTGIWLQVDPQTGHVIDGHIVAATDRDQAALEGVFEKIIRPSCWRWWLRWLARQRK